MLPPDFFEIGSVRVDHGRRSVGDEWVESAHFSACVGQHTKCPPTVYFRNKLGEYSATGHSLLLKGHTWN